MATYKNIFKPSFGNRPDQLVGRGSVLEQLESSLCSFPGSRDRCVFLVGQRGMGKTAILLELSDIAEQYDYVVARTTCNPSMLDNIIELLQRNGERQIESHKLPIKGFSAGVLGFSVGLTFSDEVQQSYGFRVKLEMLCERLEEAGKRILLLVDEVDPSSEEMRQLAQAYQEIVGEGRDIAIVMAGLPSAVSSVINQKTLTFLNRAARIELNAVSISEVATYYASAFAREGKDISNELVYKAAELTEGFPYLLQLLGYNLMQVSEGNKMITADQLEQAYTLASDDLSTQVFNAMINPLSDGDLLFLKAMAEDDGPSKIKDIEDRLGSSQGAVQTYRRRLLDAGVITSQRRGEVDFILPGLREYMNSL